MKKLLLTTLLGLASINVMANTEEASTHPLDKDQDGLISVEEAKSDTTLSAIFADLDLNKDGYLSSIELEVKSEENSD